MSTPFETAMSAITSAEQGEQAVKEAGDSFEKFASEVNELTDSIYAQLKTAGLHDSAEIWYGIISAAADCAFDKSALKGPPTAANNPRPGPTNESARLEKQPAVKNVKARAAAAKSPAPANAGPVGSVPMPADMAAREGAAAMQPDPMVGSRNETFGKVRDTVKPHISQIMEKYPMLGGGIYGAANAATTQALPIGLGAGATVGLLRELLRTPEEGEKKQYLKRMLQYAMLGGAVPLAAGFGQGMGDPAAAQSRSRAVFSPATAGV